MKIGLAGASTNNSVEATAKRADWDLVIVAEDACFTFVKQDHFGAARTAEELLTLAMRNAT